MHSFIGCYWCIQNNVALEATVIKVTFLEELKWKLKESKTMGMVWGSPECLTLTVPRISGQRWDQQIKSPTGIMCYFYQFKIQNVCVFPVYHRAMGMLILIYGIYYNTWPIYENINWICCQWKFNCCL